MVDFQQSKGQNTVNTRDSSPWIFFAMALSWSWLFWIPAILLCHSDHTVLITSLHYIGALGPMLSAIVLVYLTQDRKGQRDYWWRVIDFKRIRGKWYTVIFLIVPALAGLSALIDFLSGGEGLQLEVAAQFLDQPLMIIPSVIFILFFGPVPEELGWRGYALDPLQARFSAIFSSLILGIIWAVWHLPIFFIEGSYQYNLGVGTLSFCIFMVSIVPQTMVITWIYNNTNRSTTSAILFHFMINLVGELFELTEAADIYQFILWFAMAILVVAIWGPDKFTRGLT
jgi:uncharacterized protein